MTLLTFRNIGFDYLDGDINDMWPTGQFVSLNERELTDWSDDKLIRFLCRAIGQTHSNHLFLAGTGEDVLLIQCKKTERPIALFHRHFC